MNDKLIKKLSRDLEKVQEPDRRIEDIKKKIAEIRRKFNLQKPSAKPILTKKEIQYVHELPDRVLAPATIEGQGEVIKQIVEEEEFQRLAKKLRVCDEEETLCK